MSGKQWRGPRRKRAASHRQKNFSAAGEGLFSNVLQRAGISQQVRASRSLVEVEKILQERFGEGALLHAKPTQLKKHTLVIEVVHPAVSEQIRQQEEGIVRQVNEALGPKTVYRIQIQVARDS